MTIPDRVLRHFRKGIHERLFSDPVEFSYPVEEHGFSLDGYQLSVYSPRISPYCYSLGDGRYIIAMNSYLTSFASECALVLSADLDETEQQDLLRYNLKKFYAEQIIDRANVAIGRALLLETLLYEEHTMRDLKEKAASSTELTRRYELAVTTTSNILLQHEAAHMIQDEYSKFPDLLKELLPQGYTLPIPEADDKRDLEADAYSTCLEWRIGNKELETKLKAENLIICHSLLTCMLSMDACAKKTAELALEVGEVDITDNIFGAMPGGTPLTGRHLGFDSRGKQAIDLTIALAESDGLSPDTWKNSPYSILDKLYGVFDDVLGGETDDYRFKCEMLAHAFHGNQRGLDFLIGRSKTFRWPELMSNPMNSNM